MNDELLTVLGADTPEARIELETVSDGLLFIVAQDVRAIRESQERTEKIVTEALAEFGKSPMVKMLGGMFGGVGR